MWWLLLACAETEPDPDLDRDGIPSSLDCDDTNPAMVGVQDFWRDADVDGFGDVYLPACNQPMGTARRGGDCDDANPLVNPVAIEVCNTLDDDCDGVADGEDAAGARTWFADADRDGFGDGATSLRACEFPDGYAGASGDCDDADGRSFPGGDEVCGDGVDQDCDRHDLSCWLGGRVTARSADARFEGDQTGTYAGYAADGAGDLDGDGFDDVIVGAYAWTAPADVYPVARTGAAFVWHGPVSGERRPMTADALLVGDRMSSFTGLAVAGGGDVDGDGRDDVLVSAPYHDETGQPELGAVYGLSDPEGVVLLAQAPRVVGDDPYRYLAATTFTTVGDWDGDGGVDVLASQQEDSGLARVLAMPPHGSGLASRSDETALLDVRPPPGWMLSNPARGLGDVDGDGLPDLSVTARNFGSTGGVWIVSGPGAAPTMLLDEATLLTAGALSKEPGMAVAGGDLDGDGYGDVVWGAPGALSDGGQTGVVLFVSGPVDRDAPEPAASWLGEANTDRAGESLDIARDLDGDGRDDLLVGTPSRASATGAAYVVLDVGTGGHSLSEADFVVDGLKMNDQLGRVVAGAGDVNGDGFGDFLVGAPGYDTSAGAVFLFLGAPR